MRAGGAGHRCVSPEEADALPVKVGRGNRTGLVYDPSQPGYLVTDAPHVLCAPAHGMGGSHRYTLGGESGVPGSTLTVDYAPMVDPRLHGIGSGMLPLHKDVRQGDPGAGCMKGVASHLRRDGKVGQFVVVGGEAARRQVASGIEVAGAIFSRHFIGREVGFEGMLDLQRSTWPSGTPPWPQCWAISQNLGNAMHVDPDGARSYAVWLSAKGNAACSQHWWFLFPTHGVAIQVIHGTWISWDGRVAPHCSVVPQVALGDELLSMVCTLPGGAVRVLQRAQRCERELSRRCDAGVGGKTFYGSLEVGMHVHYRKVDTAPKGMTNKTALRKWGKAHHRWVGAYVFQVHAETLVLREDTPLQFAVTLTVHQVSNCVVCA